jgi:hypothetical protein
VVVLSLRNLASANGSLERGRHELVNMLRELNADTVEPADIEYLNGRDIFTHAIGRGLESEVPGLVNLLHDIPCDESASCDNDASRCFRGSIQPPPLSRMIAHQRGQTRLTCGRGRLRT